jgi:hypothetical protein
MNPLLQRTLFLLVLIFCPLTLYAHDNAEEVCQWVKPILLDTLSVDYQFKADDDTELRKNYTDTAWSALTMFLGSYLKIIKQQHLTLHPVFVEEPYVVRSEVLKSGLLSGVRYWRVNTTIKIPELHFTIAFSLMIIGINPSSYGHFAIQSMDMVKQDNP